MKDTKVKIPKCWICNDEGMVFYYKKINGIKYEHASRCKCVKGLRYGKQIPIVDEQFAEAIAEGNFKKFSERHPEVIKGQAV